MSTPEPRRRRRFVRLSIRALMLLALLIGAPLGWIVNRAHVQRDAVAAIRRAGGTVVYEQQAGDRRGTKAPLRTPDWIASRVGVDYLDAVFLASFVRAASDADLEQAGRLSRLRFLFIGMLPPSSGGAENPNVTDAGVAHLKGLHRLTRLGLGRTAVTNRGLVHLAGMTSLELLDLPYARIDGAGMEHLRALTNLEILRLRGTKVDDAGLARLGSLNNLQWLVLSDTRITGAGLARLKGLQRLASLQLAGTNIDDASLAQLGGLKGLYNLWLDDTPITDAGPDHLAGLSGLRLLDLTNTRATDAGVARLQTASPKLQVRRRAPRRPAPC